MAPQLGQLLGHDKYERRARTILGICFFAIIFGALFWYGGITERALRDSVRRSATGWIASGLLKHHMLRLETDNQFRTQLLELGNSIDDEPHSFKLIRPKSLGEGSPQDEFEWRVLDQFSPSSYRGHESGPAFADRLAGSNYDYYQPIRAKQSCISCHLAMGSIDGQPITDLKEGDLMAIAKVSSSDAEFQRARNENRAVLLATAMVATFLAMLSAFAVLRYTLREIGRDLQPKIN